MRCHFHSTNVYELFFLSQKKANVDHGYRAKRGMFVSVVLEYLEKYASKVVTDFIRFVG